MEFNLPAASLPDLREVMKNISIYVEVFVDNEDRSEEFRNFIRKHGVRVTRVLDKNTTHVVFKEGRRTTFQATQSLKIPMVSPKWFDACISHQRVMEAHKSPNQDADYECLYRTPLAGSEMLTTELSQAGDLYEELLGELPPETYEYYPRYLCNSCDLQMRLFKKLKDKALKTMDFLAQIPLEKQIPAMKSEEGEFMDEDDDAFIKHVKNVNDNFSGSTYDMQFDNNSQHYGDLERTFMEPAISADDSTQLLLERSGDPVIQIPTTAEIEKDCAIQHPYPLEPDKPESAEIFIPDPEHSSVLDKSDYVLEIYELLEDSTKTVHNENLLEPEDMTDMDNICAESQNDFNDEQFGDEEILDFMSSGDEYKSLRLERKQKRKSVFGERKKDFKCTVCSEIFTNNKEFKHHREFIHTQVYSCNICNKTLKTNYSLSVHMKIHNDTPEFQCDICQRTFTQKIHYQYHMNRHNNIRNYKCEQCDKAFIGKTDLKIHMRQHNGDRPYVCEICGKDYMLSEHLKSHALKHSGLQFPCELCQQNFATPKTRRQHKQTIHADKPKFKCEFCLKPFRRKHHLQYHLKQLHPSTDIIRESLYDVIDDPVNIDDCLVEDNDLNMDDDFAVQHDFVHDPGFVALTDDTILV